METVVVEQRPAAPAPVLKSWEVTPEEVLKIKTEVPAGTEIAEVGFPEFGFGFVIKAPSPGDWAAHRAAEVTSSDPYNLMHAFVLQHVVRPSPVEAQQRFERRAGLVERINTRLFELAGMRTEVTLKKTLIGFEDAKPRVFLTRDALAALVKVDRSDDQAMLGLLLVANGLVNLEVIALSLGKKTEG